MSTLEPALGNIDYEHIGAERARAKQMRQTPWWKNQIGQGKCYYCKGRFHPSELTMDHKIPLSRGGRTIRKNVVACCYDCNQKKSSLLPMEWQERE